MSRDWAELDLGPLLLSIGISKVVVVVAVVGQGLLEMVSLDVPAVGVGVVVEFVE